MPRFNRLLITGAAGNLGRELRRGLAPLATTLRISDRADMTPLAGNEEAILRYNTCARILTKHPELKPGHAVTEEHMLE